MYVASALAKFLKVRSFVRIHVDEIETIERRRNLERARRTALDLLLSRFDTCSPAPLNAFEIEFADWRNKRFDRQKSYARVCPLQVRDPRFGLLVLNRDAKPHVGRSGAIGVAFIDKFLKEGAAFGQHLVDVPVRLFH